MINYKFLHKIVSIVIIGVFLFHFQSNILLHSQEKVPDDEVLQQFNIAKDLYNQGKMEEAKRKLIRLIRILNEEKYYPNYSRKKEILGKSHLFLGVIDVMEGNEDFAKQNYNKAIVDYDTESIEIKGVDLKMLPIYKRSLIEGRFEKAKRKYLEGKQKKDTAKFENAKKILEGLEKELDEAKKEDKEYLGKVYILLGAANEKLFELSGEKITRKQKKLLKKYYRKKGRKLFPPKEAQKKLPQNTRQESSEKKGMIKKEKCNPIEGIDLSDLKYFKKYYCKGKKISPLLVVGGAIVVAFVIYKLLPKHKTLTVTLDEGVEGNPGSGTHEYKKGERVTYSYRSTSGYSNLKVLLDGNQVASSGTIEMNRDHTLRATASENEVHFITDRDDIEVPEGGTAALNVKLSAQPKNDVNVTIRKQGGDEDIRIISGESLTFTTSDWGTSKTVTLQAVDDADNENGQATIEIQATNEPDIATKTITVTEKDDNPTVSIVRPQNGDTVSGIEVIEAEASGLNGIKRVDFYVDGKKIESDYSAPYRKNWDTRPYLEGPHDIKVIAYDTKDKTAEAEISVNVVD